MPEIGQKFLPFILPKKLREAVGGDLSEDFRTYAPKMGAAIRGLLALVGTRGALYPPLRLCGDLHGCCNVVSSEAGVVISASQQWTRWR
jgi:hypothetical protein